MIGVVNNMFSKVCRVGNDPELKFTASGTAVLNLSLVYNYGKKMNDCNRPSQWIEAAMFGKQAEALAPYINKRDQVSVSIEDLHIETYPKRDGGEGFKMCGRIVAFDFVGKSQASESKPEPKQESKGGFDDFVDVPF